MVFDSVIIADKERINNRFLYLLSYLRFLRFKFLIFCPVEKESEYSEDDSVV